MKTILCLLLLSISIDVAGQRPKISFDAKNHNFGKVEAKDGVVSHAFAFTNKGSRPLLIIDVESSCGCTVPGWSDRPVLPGDSGEITVNFNPANLSGKFSKKITVYSSGDVATRLKITGEVIAPGDAAALYPFAIGSLRMSADTVRLSANRKARVVRIFNAGKKKISITSIMKPNHITVDQTPVVLLPGLRGDLVFLYSPVVPPPPAHDRVLITTSEGKTGMVNVNIIPDDLPR
ncbi:MAG: DUF1573 domain-containing protein [Odoribacteraceae bacterium]|nr:DUF1573 domain-containing protein [Odoribacteraceae bacterium]